MKPIIQVRDLTAGYGEDIILDNISFEIDEGEIFVILGGSGCGKTTLLKTLLGLLKPLSGEVYIDGDDIVGCDEETFQKVLRKTGVLYQGGALFGSMTVAENIALPIREYTDLSQKAICDLVKLKLGLVGLKGVGDRLPSELSGGMKKRAGLARAMALSPKILFFDEPSTGLDPIIAAGLDNLIIHLNKSLRTTMVIVTHDLHSIFAVSDRIIMLESKEIIAEGDPKDLRDHSPDRFVKQFFNRQAKASIED